MWSRGLLTTISARALFTMESIADVPLKLIDFSNLEIYSYCEKLKSTLGSDFSFLDVNKKGLLLFKEKHVNNICFKVMPDSKVVISSCVKAEMKKSINYKTSVQISAENEIQTAICECPGGSNPASCKHVFAMLCALVDYSQKKLYDAPTEQLQKWHQPRPKLISPKKSSDIFKPHASNYSTINSVNYSALFGENCNFPIFSVLECTDHLFKVETIPLPALVYTRLNIEMPDFLNIEEVLYFHQNIKISLEEAWEIELQTTEQSQSNLWKKHRQIRLTASAFHSIAHRVADFDTLAANIFRNHQNDLSKLPAISFGSMHESIIRNFVRSQNTSYILRRVGVVTNPNIPYLCASPDGLLFNKENAQLVEIKCCYNPENIELNQLAKRPNFCLHNVEGIWKLKKTHAYFYQIQGQLAISNLIECQFTFYYRYPNHIHTEIIHFDPVFWNNLKQQLKKFYFNYYIKFCLKC